MGIQIVIQTQQRDIALLEQLFHCHTASQNQQHHGASLPDHLVTLVSQTADTFRQHYDTLQTQRSAYKDINRRVREAESELQRSIRHALQGVRRHQKLLEELRISLNAFGLTEAGTFPEHMKRMRVPVEIAKNMLNAHLLVEASGHNVLRDPTAAELNTQIVAIEAGKQRRKHLRDGEQAALNQIRKTRILAQRVLRTVRQYIQNMSIGLNKEEQRMILKEYGFKYITRKTYTDTVLNDEGNNLRPPNVLNTEGNNLRPPKVADILARDTDPGSSEHNGPNELKSHEHNHINDPESHDHNQPNDPKSHEQNRRRHQIRNNPKPMRRRTMSPSFKRRRRLFSANGTKQPSLATQVPGPQNPHGVNNPKPMRRRTMSPSFKRRRRQFSANGTKHPSLATQITGPQKQTIPAPQSHDQSRCY